MKTQIKPLEDGTFALGFWYKDEDGVVRFVTGQDRDTFEEAVECAKMMDENPIGNKVYVVLRDQKYENRGEKEFLDTTVELVSLDKPTNLIFDVWEDYKTESYLYLQTRLRLIERKL